MAYDKVLRYLSNERKSINIIEFGVAGFTTTSFLFQSGNANKVKIESYHGFYSFQGIQLTNQKDSI